MPFSRVYLVPDYYRNFVCKGTSCRRTCCRDWRVTLSFKEYNRLIGLNCSKKLRKKLDCAFIPADNRSMERYAIVKPNFEGYCPMRMYDGLCALHKECGEKILPAICRYYPRAPRNRYAPECSCTNSCERVLEMLFEREEKLSFESLPLTFDYEDGTRVVSGPAYEIYDKLSGICIDILQDRKLCIYDRLYKLGLLINEAAAMPISELPTEIDELIFRYKDSSIIISIESFEKYFDCGYEVIKKIAAWFTENSPSLYEYAEEINAIILTEKGREQHAEAEKRFNESYPKWQVFFENMLVNHLFYIQFPFVEGCNFRESYSALLGAYAFVKFIALQYSSVRNEAEDLIDICGAAFRIIEHSAFYKKVNIMLKAEGMTTLDSLLPLLTI